MKYFMVFLGILILGASAFFVFFQKNILVLPDISETQTSNISTLPIPVLIPKKSDIEPQKPLANPPEEIRAVYFTGWSAGSQKKINYLIDLVKNTKINAVVIDIKDFSGYIGYDIKNSDVEKYNAKEIRIEKINSLIKRLHDENIYVIARITVFQDPILAQARPDLAIHSKSKCQLSSVNCQMSSSILWLDHKKLAWIDPAAKESWDYNINIAKDAASRGFDELNFDYIRFASDGDLNDMEFPHWDGKIPKSKVIKNFFEYLREQLTGIKISADLFGLSTINSDDLGIGQTIENAYQYFDYVSPMVYPSHYAKMFLEYKNPAQYPYEVVKYSMDAALKRLSAYREAQSATSTISITTISDLRLAIGSKLRPWLQDFDLGANYGAEMVKKEIQAVYDAASSTPDLINGYMVWSPLNVYTKEALE